MSKLAIVVVACASCAATPPPHASEPSPPMVYIDAVIVEVAPGHLASTKGKTAAELATMPGIIVRSHPITIAMNRERTGVTLGCTPPTTCAYYALSFLPEIVNDDLVRVDAEIHGDVFAHANTVIRRGEMFEVQTTRPVAPAVPNSTTLVQLRATVVHDQAEVRKLHSD